MLIIEIMKAKHINIKIMVRQYFNLYFDKIVNPSIVIAGISFNSYLFWVYTGFFIGTAIIFAITIVINLNLSIMAIMVMLVALLLFALYKSTKVVGKSFAFLNWARKSVYHYQIIALAFTMTFLWSIKEPVLPYLDVMVLALILYQAFGRIGCFMSGCCHGRPHSWGVCYGKKHLASGYPYFLEKVRLFPIQLIESIWLFFLALICTIVITNGNRPGNSVSWYITGYGFGRFAFEFLRGNLNRPYWLWFSEAQWTAITLTLVVVCLEIAGFLNFHWLHFCLLSLMTLVVLNSLLLTHFQNITKQQLLHPDHILEILQNINWISDRYNLLSLDSKQDYSKTKIFSGVTSLGIQISRSIVLKDGNQSYRYLLSHNSGKFEKKAAKTLSILICRLKHPERLFNLFEKKQGIFQLIVN